MPDNLLRTERTTIDLISTGDAGFFVELLNSPGWLQYIGDKGVSDENDARCFIKDRFLSSYTKHGYGYYLVRLKTNGVGIGIVGFTNRAEYENPDFGFAFLPGYQGQGLALESAHAILNYGTTYFGLNVLDAGTLMSNHAAARLLGKLGFQTLGEMENNWGQGRLVLHRRWQHD